MKNLKLALLGGAALAVTSAGAYADDLSTLKSSMETMNSAVITPVADAPEGATITWSGYVRQALTYASYDSYNGSDHGFDMASGRAMLTVNATTPTSVGDVDVVISFRENQDTPNYGPYPSSTGDDDVFHEAYGVWHMTPEFSLKAGKFNMTGLGNLETFGHTTGLHEDFATTTDYAMSLNYASGPVAFAIGLEDGQAGLDKSPDLFATMAWKGDTVSLNLQGNYIFGNNGFDNAWEMQGGAEFALGMASIGVVGVVGHDDPNGWYGDRGDYAGAIARVKANITETTYAELSGGYLDADTFNRWNVNAGVYYNPVSQLKIGLQGDYTDENAPGKVDDWHGASVSLVTWFSF